MILFEEGDTRAQQDEAHQVLAVLCEVYPGHPWAVRVAGGIVFIRMLRDDGKLSGYGMNVKWHKVNHDAAVLRREIIRMAGEWLERAGLIRGRANGDEIIRVEGVPEKHQPYYKPPVENVVVDISGAPLRTTPRPQALKEL